MPGPYGRGRAPDLVAVRVRLVRALHRHRDVASLVARQTRELDAELSQMQPCHLLVQHLLVWFERGVKVAFMLGGGVRGAGEAGQRTGQSGTGWGEAEIEGKSGA